MKLFTLLQISNISWFDIVVVSFIFFIFWLIVANIEATNKIKDLFYNKSENLIAWALGIFFALVLLFHMIRDIPTATVIAVIVFKVILAIFVSNKAFQLGRNKTLWFFLGLLEHFTALIVLGLYPKYITNTSLSKGELKEINQDIQSQLKKLKELMNSGLMSRQEYEQKLILLKEQYYEKCKKSVSHITVIDNKKLVSQLKQAYKDGLLTEEEYQIKLQKLTTN